eukprot:15365013-Ditylum_brightwellii.AAC.1
MIGCLSSYQDIISSCFLDPFKNFQNQRKGRVFDDSIFAGPSNKSIDQAIRELKKKDGKNHLTQLYIIAQILQQVCIKEKQGIKSTTAASTKILQRNHSVPLFGKTFHYRLVIVKVNYLKKCTIPDNAYVTHQCMQFCEDPRSLHGDAVIHMTKHLAAAKEAGLILDLNTDRSFEVHAGADFVGN